MPAFDVFVVERSFARVQHFRHHFARVAGMDAVVAGRGGEQHRRVVFRRVKAVVGRVVLQVCPFFGFVRVTVFGHPRGAGEQFVVALHVQQRYLHHNRAEQFRVLGEHVAHE